MVGDSSRGVARASAMAALVAVVVCAALGACASRYHRASLDLDGPQPPAEQLPLRLFLTGATGGSLRPCGCESGQWGGLARRATYLRAARREGDLTLDLGNLVPSDAPSYAFTLETALAGLETIGYDAILPGDSELLVGDVFEEALARHPGLRAICANLWRGDGGGRVHEPWLLHRTADGRTVAVVGVIEPFSDLPPRYRITPVEDAVREALAELDGKADAVFVAGALREDDALALAAEFPQATLVIGGWTSESTGRVVPTSGAPAMLVGDFAWYVGRVDFDRELRVANSWQAWLDEALPDDPDAAGLVARHDAAVSQEGGAFAEKLVAALRERGFVGSAACAECHRAETETWHGSRHAHAMRTLVGKGSQRIPACIACHLMDVPHDASQALDPDALGLGCETCHGGGSRHVDLARGGALAAAADALAPATRDACLRCHTPPNDTHFDFDRHWPRIAHGRAAAR
jgi:2',3'-cyclic-nucleotide 2'-phosphodiesterase (5'-nucleotidase family)